MKRISTLLFMGICMLLWQGALAQGTTTGNISGTVVDENNEPLIGATVVANHTPTGTMYGTITDVSGNYRFANIKVGGPYTLEISYVGYQDINQSDVYVGLGQHIRIDYIMQSSNVALDVVTVTGTATNAGQGSGASTQIRTEDIEMMPTTGRDLRDYTRLSPYYKESFGGGISIAGVNNRYNAIYIDGAVNNDVFGLAASGTNGGQTGISPFSPDILDQIQVVVSPYDVSLGGFAGGGINAVTKSGTNEWKGTAYFYTQNENLVGKTNQLLSDRTGSDREKVDEFTSNIYGASLGGPIVKNKVFFFGNVELQQDETPSPFDFGTYDGDSDQSKIDQLADKLRNDHGYDPGGYLGKTNTLDGLKLFGKLDINLNDKNKLTLRHQYTKAEETDPEASDNNEIHFENDGVFFPSVTNSTAAELNSTIGSKFSNNLIVGYTSVRDDRDPMGDDFPYVIIEDGDGDIELGSEQFSTANQLDQDIFTITDNFKIYNGDHTFTIGTHNEFISIYNLFIRQNYGVYRFASIDDFLNDAPAIEYDRSYSLVDNVTGDGSAAGGEFGAMQLGFYVQDEWAVNKNLTLTGGIRLDVPIITDDPDVHEGFAATLETISQHYDLSDAEAGKAPQGQLMLSPRLGFNYDVQGNNSTILRGGLGVFTSRIPFVWPGGMFTNNGITIGGLNERDINGDIVFIDDINGQYTNENFTVPSGQVDLFAGDFKYPQLFRGSLALDHDFGSGLSATVEGIYSKTLNNVDYTNVNSDPTVDFNWTGGPDNRPVFTRTSIDPAYSAIYLASNTDEGYTYSITGSVNKEFDFGVVAGLAYTYGDSEAKFEGTSSQNSSQWRGNFHVNGRNDSEIGRSDFSIGHRILGYINYTMDWAGDGNYATSVGLFYNGESGLPYSYVYNGSGARNLNNETGSTSRNRSLIWVPADRSEINLVATSDATVDEQWAALDKYIQEDDYLSENRGQYAEKNSNRAPFSNIFDLKIVQNLGVGVGGRNHRLQLSCDIENFLNLINPEWGIQYNNPFDYRLIDFEGYAADGTTPQFTFTEEDLGDDRFSIWDFGSRWAMRLGVRYIFD